MIPRLHPKGHSFKGAAAYLLHDKKADTAHRVAWTETRNLAVDDAQVAWKIMSATAQSQDTLKARAGIKNTGRKSNAHVLHFSLSWSEEETPTLTKEEMLRAAQSALHALGATDRQAIIVCHSDEPHGHVHVLLNRVSPEDGRILSSSKEKLALSKFAEGYERERGLILCEERVLNNAARARGEFTRSSERARARYENDNNPERDHAYAEARRAKLAELSQRGRNMADRHAAAWREIDRAHKARTQEIRTAARHKMRAQEKAIRERFRDDWTLLFHEHQAARIAHIRNEGRMLGRAQNSIRAIDFQAVMRATERRAAISAAFRAFSSTGARLDELKRAQAIQSRELALRQQREERRAAQQIAAEQQQLLAENRTRLFAERSSLILTQQMEDTALQASWRELNRARNRNLSRQVKAIEPVRQQVQAAGGAAKAPANDTARSRQKPELPVPDVRKEPEQAGPELTRVFEQAAAAPKPEGQAGTEGRVHRMAEHAKRMKEKAAEKSRHPDRDREIDRDR